MVKFLAILMVKMKVKFLDMFPSMREEMSNGAGIAYKLAHENACHQDVKIRDSSEVLYLGGHGLRGNEKTCNKFFILLSYLHQNSISLMNSLSTGA